jgi:hypothetical protein
MFIAHFSGYPKRFFETIALEPGSIFTFDESCTFDFVENAAATYGIKVTRLPRDSETYKKYRGFVCQVVECNIQEKDKEALKRISAKLSEVFQDLMTIKTPGLESEAMQIVIAGTQIMNQLESIQHRVESNFYHR